jgi:hypothetical protein
MSSLGDLSLDTLGAHCCEENRRFHAHEPSDTRYCLELWRCALHENASLAWQHLITCFAPTLARKLAGSSLGQVVIWRRSRSATRPQAERSVIEDAFAQMAAGNARGQLEVRSVGALVEFLWTCAENLMKKELRVREPLPLPLSGESPPPAVAPSPHGASSPPPTAFWRGAEPLSAESLVTEPSDPIDLPRRVESRDALAQAAIVMRGCAADDRQYLAGKLLIFWQYTAEEVIAGKFERSERYRGVFTDVMELHRIKAKLLRCMREHLDPSRSG